MYLARTHAAAGALALMAAACWLPGDASAQQIYKIVGPDGRVTFTDRAPTDPAAKAAPAPVVPLAGGAATDLSTLPFELRQAATRYPVTIYTSPGCQTCARGRSMLLTRGIPFSEKSVATKEDGDALMRLTGASSVPVLMIGGQQLKGYSDSEWTQFLDAAGYPKTSQLPPSYTPAPATPLVAVDQPRPDVPAPAPAQQQQQQPQRPPQPQGPTADNPANIQF